MAAAAGFDAVAAAAGVGPSALRVDPAGGSFKSGLGGEDDSFTPHGSPRATATQVSVCFDTLQRGGKLDAAVLAAGAARLKLGYGDGSEATRRMWRDGSGGDLGAVDHVGFRRACERSTLLRALVGAVTERAAMLRDYAPPAGYDFSVPTHTAHGAGHMEFFGSCTELREGGDPPTKRDYKWHNNYTEARQLWQDHVVRMITCRINKQARPWIIFSCGGMGVGKGYTFNLMSRLGYFPLEEIVRIDPDHIRSLMPEWDGYVAADMMNAGNMTGKESGYIQELCQEQALRSRQNIWVDGSLRNSDWFTQVFEDIRRRFPWYQIGVFAVFAEEKTVMQRVAARAQETGRGVPEELVHSSCAAAPMSLFKLSRLCDWTAQIANDTQPCVTCFSHVERKAGWHSISARFRGHGASRNEFPMRLAPLWLRPLELGAAITVDAPPHAGDPARRGAAELTLRVAGGGTTVFTVGHPQLLARACSNAWHVEVGAPCDSDTMAWLPATDPAPSLVASAAHTAADELRHRGGFVFFRHVWHEHGPGGGWTVGGLSAVTATPSAHVMQFGNAVRTHIAPPESAAWHTVSLPTLRLCGARRVVWLGPCDSPSGEAGPCSSGLTAKMIRADPHILRANSSGGFLYEAELKEEEGMKEETCYVFFPMKCPPG